MSNSAKLHLPDGQSIDLPVLTGSENEKAIDISNLRAKQVISHWIQDLSIQVHAKAQLLTLTERRGYYSIVVIQLKSWLSIPHS